MKWIRDKTGRFPQRPFFESGELDFECEALVSSFLIEKYGKVKYPISTNDLSIIVERETSDLDLYADLTVEGSSVEGMTIFLPSDRPKVLISQDLSTVSGRENRLRTTLTHEFAHVKFHNFIWSFQQQTLFGTNSKNITNRCNRESILNARDVDWMEWQAGYSSGAFLMPISRLKDIVHQLNLEMNIYGKASVSSVIGRRMIAQVQSVFQVSEDAARVRLIKMDYLQEGEVVSHSGSLL